MKNRRLLLCRLVVATWVLTVSSCRSMQQLTCEAGKPTKPSNFGEVIGSNGEHFGIYRGGQPKSCTDLDFLKALGIKTIVKLNDDHVPIDLAEEREAEARSIHVELFTMDARTIGQGTSCPDVRRIINFIQNPADRPVYVHCQAGRDRTGYIVGTYEEVVLHKSIDDVLRELAQHHHSGYATLIYPQIRRELKSGNPSCLH